MPSSSSLPVRWLTRNLWVTSFVSGSYCWRGMPLSIEAPSAIWWSVSATTHWRLLLAALACRQVWYGRLPVAECNANLLERRAANLVAQCDFGCSNSPALENMSDSGLCDLESHPRCAFEVALGTEGSKCCC
jgi:hypothetical protein